MDYHLGIAVISVVAGFWLRGSPDLKPVAPTLSQPCTCHCSCECPSPSRDPTLPLLIGILILVLVAIGVLIFHHLEQEIRPVGSPKGGKGVQGASGRILPLLQQ